MTPLSSPERGSEEASAASTGEADGSSSPERGSEEESAPPAEQITDPALAAEVDNPAASNAPTGAEATPGPSAADRPPLPATGAPGELASDQTPPQGQEQDQAAPASELGAVAGGDAGAPEGSPSTGVDVVVPASPASPPPISGGATVPEQPVAVAPADAAPVPPPEPEPAEVDQTRTELVERLRGALGDGVVDAHIRPGVDVWVRVDIGSWHRAFEVCRDDLGLTYFDFLSAIDWLLSPYGRSEDAGADEGDEGDEVEASTAPAPAGAPLEHGITGGESRFQLLARLVSPTSHLGLTLKADVDDGDPRAPTVSDVYPGSDWHERETWEMYGIDFTGHPNLVHLYLPGAFEGHPLRKDFPLLAREVKPWPGLVDVEAMPGEPEAAAS